MVDLNPKQRSALDLEVKVNFELKDIEAEQEVIAGEGEVMADEEEEEESAIVD